MSDQTQSPTDSPLEHPDWARARKPISAIFPMGVAMKWHTPPGKSISGKGMVITESSFNGSLRL